MRRRSLALVTATVLAASLVAPLGASADDTRTGRFAAALVEPVIYEGDRAVRTDEKCIESTDPETGRTYQNCKPAAGSLAVLPDGRLLYWNALEGTENVEYGIATEYGRVSINDQSRVLDFASMTWTRPSPLRADVGGGQATTILPQGVADDSALAYNDNALFCTDLVHLPDGTVLVAGGTNYYSEPGNAAIPDHEDGGPYGVVELEGQTTSRVFDSATDSWRSAGEMAYGRWYPTLVTLADGRVLTSSGVTKLMKPVYPDPTRPREDGPSTADSGRNVTQHEVFDPATATWTLQPESADRSLPLYPRLHLLPDGDVFYNASGQVYNPQGQAYDQALWNIAASYDPDTATWTDLGVPGLSADSDPEAMAFHGFRGSTFSMMLPLRPDADGAYRTAEFLQAGGIVGTTPGTYVAVDHSRITTVTVGDDAPSMATRSTGPLNTPRWYGTAAVLPTGEVFVANGSSGDEVVGPGTAAPVNVTEIFDPVTETWRQDAEQDQGRAYHNTATLLPDGRVLLGGHAPISGLYGANGGYRDNPNDDGRLIDTPVHRTSRNDGRDPSFDIYEPWYVDAERPRIVRAETARVHHGGQLTLEVDTRIDELVLIRNTALTHEIDADQRAVELDFRQTGSSVRARIPGGAVLPNGPYMAFVLKDGVPSVSAQVTVVNHPRKAVGKTRAVARPGAGDVVAPSGDAPTSAAPSGVDTIADVTTPATARSVTSASADVQATAPVSTSTDRSGARWVATVLLLAAAAASLTSRAWVRR